MLNSLSRVLPEVQGGFPLGTSLLVDNDQDGGGSTITASAIGNSRMFTARQFDEETGLYHYRARAYSPELRRFIQRDPLEYVDGPSAVAYVCSNPIVAGDAAGTTVKSRLGARSPAPDPPLTGYPPAGGIGNPVERPPDDEPGNVGGGAGVSTDLWWDRPTMTGKSVATFLGIHRYFRVTGPHEYAFYQYVWDYFVIDPPPPGVSPGGSISGSRSPNGYVPDDGEQGKRGGHYPHQSRSGGSAELRDGPGKAYHGTGSNQSEANQSMIGTVYADWEHYVPGGFPAGTRSVTFVQAFVTYVIDLTVGRVVGWWEWSYSIRIDVGPPP